MLDKFLNRVILHPIFQYMIKQVEKRLNFKRTDFTVSFLYYETT